MKKLFLILLLVISGCNTYLDDYLGCSINYPGSWTAIIQNDKCVLIASGNGYREWDYPGAKFIKIDAIKGGAGTMTIRIKGPDIIKSLSTTGTDQVFVSYGNNPLE